jgi:hypothetical protein
VHQVCTYTELHTNDEFISQISWDAFTIFATLKITELSGNGLLLFDLLPV